MMKRFVGCGGWRLRIRKEGVWGEYCVGEGKGEERGDVRVIGKIDSEGGRM